MRPPDELLERLERLFDARPASWQPRAGGYTTTKRWSVRLDDGRDVFVKLATADLIREQLRAEHRNLLDLPRDYRCEVLGWQDGDRPMLVLEDLGDARWPPPWRPGDVERVLETLRRVAATEPPAHLPSQEVHRDALSGWQKVAGDPSTFLALGIASEAWLDECLPTLIAAERELVLGGDELVHFDVRSDNLCFDGDRVVIVDWNWACRGDARTDVAFWLPSLRLEGGPSPEEVMTDAGPYAAAFAGVMGAAAGLPAPATAPTVRRFQLRQLRIALPWACRELGLPQPGVRYAARELGTLSADLAAGRIDEATWYAGGEEVLIDAYLASDDPRSQSGKSGDEREWRWAREHVLDVTSEGDHVLDVGCANGYLMESLERWGAERSLSLNPWGLDLSWRIAEVARRRVPHLAERIFVGNVIDWRPPRRFDVVHTALDYTPRRRRRDHLERVLRDLLVPGGRLVLRPERAGGDRAEPATELAELGYAPDGVLERVHPVSGERRRTAWLRAPVG